MNGQKLEISVKDGRAVALRIVVNALNGTHHKEDFSYRDSDRDRTILRQAMRDLWELLK